MTELHCRHNLPRLSGLILKQKLEFYSELVSTGVGLTLTTNRGRIVLSFIQCVCLAKTWEWLAIWLILILKYLWKFRKALNGDKIWKISINDNLIFPNKLYLPYQTLIFALYLQISRLIDVSETKFVRSIAVVIKKKMFCVIHTKTTGYLWVKF